MKVGRVFLFLGLLGLSVPTEQKMSPGNSAVAPAIGLELGQLAPAFTKADQFGKEQSNQTLKGSKGTILLFFRSADW